MFDNTSVPHPLTISGDMAIVPNGNPIISPASSNTSGSSGSSSPDAGPYTPVGCVEKSFAYPVPPHDAQNANYVSRLEMEGDVLSGGPLNVSLDYGQFSWDGTGTWENQNSLLVGDEFDMTAIPPIELGIPGCSEQSAPTSVQMARGQEFDPTYHPQTFGLFDFEDMDILPGPQGY